MYKFTVENMKVKSEELSTYFPITPSMRSTGSISVRGKHERIILDLNHTVTRVDVKSPKGSPSSPIP